MIGHSLGRMEMWFAMGSKPSKVPGVPTKKHLESSKKEFNHPFNGMVALQADHYDAVIASYIEEVKPRVLSMDYYPSFPEPHAAPLPRLSLRHR